MAMNDLADKIIEEAKKSGKQLALVCGGVFLLTFLIVVISRCGGKEQAAESGQSRRVGNAPAARRLTSRSGSRFLDTALPLSSPRIELARTPGVRPPQLKMRSYSLTEKELFHPVSASSNRTAPTGRATNTGIRDRVKPKTPEIDMILKRPPARAGKRAEY